MLDLKKRFFDFAVAISAIMVCAPIMICIALLICMLNGMPILFRQKRSGLNGKPFILVKFRTMTEEHDEHGNLLPDFKRLTHFGRFLRSTSLDELPALINVLKSDMSLVGPRPLLIKYLDRYTPEQARRHEVKPGVTGWAQINGRNAITWGKKLEYDVWYVDHQSFWLDLKIIALTIWKILKREGINQQGHATAEEFDPWITPTK